jgi:hypothetical protein
VESEMMVSIRDKEKKGLHEWSLQVRLAAAEGL